jgi:hypothetical protein
MKYGFGVAIGSVLGVALTVTTLVIAESDSDGPAMLRPTQDVQVIDNAQYQQECGACHLAYQPGWLPARSWTALMDDLGNHFGDDATLDPEVAARLTVYLTAHAADVGNYRRSRQIAQSVAADTAPLRISETPYIRAKHREIPARLIADNPQVKSLGRCDTCHGEAAEGIYNEHRALIPGYGAWED